LWCKSLRFLPGAFAIGGLRRKFVAPAFVPVLVLE
jgi:hypothetical protein